MLVGNGSFGIGEFDFVLMIGDFVVEEIVVSRGGDGAEGFGEGTTVGGAEIGDLLGVEGAGTGGVTGDLRGDLIGEGGAAAGGAVGGAAGGGGGVGSRD